MRTGDKKLFLNKDKLTIMLNLRLNGWATTSLALLFGCDTSSIRNQCTKYEIVPFEVFTVETIASKVNRDVDYINIGQHWKYENGERINIGRSYKEYLDR